MYDLTVEIAILVSITKLRPNRNNIMNENSKTKVLGVYY